MAVCIDAAAVIHLHDFLDPVGELVAAIVDIRRRLALPKIAIIDVGDAAHARRFPNKAMRRPRILGIGRGG